MLRLHYSRNGIVRAIEMSRSDATAFVEGFTDRTFFGAIIASNTAAVGKSVEIRFAHELHPALGSGKAALLGLHKKLKKHNRLLFSVGSEQKAVMFFLDKDIDDLKRSLRRCPHVIYTEHYSVENYLFRNGDLIQALTCGACLDNQSIGAWPSNHVWTNQAAKQWAEWIAYCLLVVNLKPSGLPNFGVRSLIHGGEYTPLEPVKQKTLLNAVSKRTGKSMAVVRSSYMKELRRVEELLHNDSIDKFFNGKWYTGFLAKDARRLASGRQLPNQIEERIEAVLLATLNFQKAWAKELQAKITSILKQL